ncbi:unnamed protein product, partial [Allacma fusca]
GVLCSRFDHKKRKAQKVANLDNFKFDPNGNAASFVTELERLSGEVDPSITEEEIIAKARGKLPPMMAAIACTTSKTLEELRTSLEGLMKDPTINPGIKGNSSSFSRSTISQAPQVVEPPI